MKIPIFSATAVLAGALACPMPVFAQAPPTAPLVLTMPSSARVTALGGAWVAGRDQDVIFSNPAQLVGVRSDFSVSMAKLGDHAEMASLTSAYSAGKLSFTLGWGVQVVNFRNTGGGLPPYSQDVFWAPETLLHARPTTDAQSALATVGGAILYKGFRIGAAAKYAADRDAVNRHAIVADIGVARNLLGGTAALAVQNLGRDSLGGDTPLATLPRQIAAGFSEARSAGPLDLTIFTQLSYRSGWTAPAAGLEAGYSWLEGYSITLRAGVRRPETTAEQPISLGGAFTADRLTLEYALRLYDNSRRAHVVTIRWR